MSFAERLSAILVRIAVAAALLAAPAAQAGNVQLASAQWREDIQARFDPIAQATRVAGRAAPRLCFSFSLPQEWSLEREGPKARLRAASSSVEIEMSLRSAHELRHLPQPDLASRDAALLQRDYEEILGRPAQSVSLAASASGATRWSATWIDGNLPSASHAVTFEAFIVPLSHEWVLELSLTNGEMREVHGAFMERILSGLRVRSDAAC